MTFEHAGPRRYHVVIGADGLHSNVRRLVFGEDAARTRFLGGYLAVLSVPKSLAPDGEMIIHLGVGRIAGIYTAQPLDDARALFLFRSKPNSTITTETYCGRRNYCATRSPGCLRRWTAGLPKSTRRPPFYFDSITQLSLDIWSRGELPWSATRVTVLGPRLAAAPAFRSSARMSWPVNSRSSRRLSPAFAAYQQQLAEPVRLSRAFARTAAKTLVPGSAAGVWALTRGAQLISMLPAGPLTRAIAKRNTKGVGVFDSMQFKDYGTPVVG